jgi:hypothetical protein
MPANSKHTQSGKDLKDPAIARLAKWAMACTSNPGPSGGAIVADTDGNKNIVRTSHPHPF